MEAEVTIRMLTISAMTTEADVGDGLQLVAIGITSADTEVDLTNEVTWLSSDSDVASVDQGGQVTIEGLGNAIIMIVLMSWRHQVAALALFPTIMRRRAQPNLPTACLE